MWRWVAGIVLAIAVIVTVAARLQHYTTEKYEAEREKACVSLSISPEEKHSCEKEAQSRHDYSPWWYVLIAWPGGIMALATIATGAVIAWQSHETRKSARAAEESTRISLGTSLPKLVVHKLSTRSNTTDARSYFEWPAVDITIKNYGNTPAILHFWSLCFSIQEFSDEPEYSGPASGMSLDKSVVESGKEFVLPTLFHYRRQQFTKEEAAGIATRQHTLYVYGFVAYRDIFGSPLKRFKFCETVLNVYDGNEVICDWWEHLNPPSYEGTDVFPSSRSESRFVVVGRKFLKWCEELADEE